MNNPKAGPFFSINGVFLFNALPLASCEKRGEKLDNPYSHEQLFKKWPDSIYKDYINYPRGRVVWDLKMNQAIIYIDPCIRNEETIGKVIDSFGIDKYLVEEDIHYHCAKCVDNIWDT